MCWPNADVLVRMDPPQEAVDEIVESVNPLDQSSSGPFDSTTNEYASTEALVKKKNLSGYGKGLRSTHDPSSSE